MTHKQLERIVRDWQQRLGLERWEITIEWDKPTDDNVMAEIAPYQTYDTATLKFSADHVKWSAAIGEQTVVHELLHVCLRDVSTSWRAASDELHPAAKQHADGRYTDATEGFVDRLAYRLMEIAG